MVSRAELKGNSEITKAEEEAAAILKASEKESESVREQILERARAEIAANTKAEREKIKSLVSRISKLTLSEKRLKEVAEKIAKEIVS